MFAYDSASQQLVVFPPFCEGNVPLAFKLTDLQKMGWTIDHASCVASLPRADRRTGSPITVASPADLARLKNGPRH